MKHAKIVFIILISLLFMSCAGEPGPAGEAGISGQDGTSGIDGVDGKDGDPGKDGIDGADGINGDNGANGSDGTDSTTDIVTVYNLSGKFEKGRCWEGGEIRVWPIEDGTLTQRGTHFIGTTGENGTYNIRAETTEQYALIYSKLTCDDEINGGSGLQELFGYRKTSDPDSNINILTKISKPVADWLLDDPESETYGKVNESLAEAEKLTYEFLGMPALESFSKMSLQKDSTSDAALALVSSMILEDMTPAEQADYTSRISTGIIENNLDLKAVILELYGTLPLLTIKDNLESSYLAAGIEIDTPPTWRLLDYPDYYADLLERDPVVQGSFNLEDAATCSMDMGYKRYAVPHVLKSWIETSNYLASNLDKNVSIWSRGVHGGGYDAPGIKLLDIEELREKLLDSNLSFHGMIDGHSLSAGNEVYFVIESETAFVLSVGCNGGLLPWGRKLASNDGGVTYIGWNNNTVFFRKSGLKLSGVN